MKTLDEIGVASRCKKASTHHDYLHFFEGLVGHLRDRPCRILELGVLRGESMRMWLEAFPHSQVVGVDINLLNCRVTDPRLTLIAANAADPDALQAIARQHGPFDFIVDDCSHTPDVTGNVLRLFAEHVVPGGWLFVEDINIDYEQGTGQGIAAQIRDLVTAINHRGLMHYCGKQHWKPGYTPFEGALREVRLRPGIAALQRDLP